MRDQQRSGARAEDDRTWLPEYELDESFDAEELEEAIRKGRQAEYRTSATDLELPWAS